MGEEGEREAERGTENNVFVLCCRNGVRCFELFFVRFAICGAAETRTLSSGRGLFSSAWQRPFASWRVASSAQKEGTSTPSGGISVFGPHSAPK